MRGTLLVSAALTAAFAAEHPLFNGRNLEGWVAEGPNPAFSAVAGELVVGGTAHWPHWLHTADEYEDFDLAFEYRLDRWAQAGVILRAPRDGRPARTGLALVLAHDFHPGVADDHVTGAILGARAPLAALPESFDAWHRASISLRGSRLEAAIDGVAVQKLDLDADPELRYRLRRGYIGFPDLGHRWRVRNVRIDDRGRRVRYAEPFDGGTLSGWDRRNGGAWKAASGVLSADGGDGILYAPGVFGDFELTVQVRTTGHVNSGVFLRGDPAGPRRGFEIQIYSPPDAVDYTTGSIYGRVRARPVADHEGRWLLLQVRLEGARCVVRLDGETVAVGEAPVLEPGRIGFQIHSERSRVEFRDLRIRPL